MLSIMNRTFHLAAVGLLALSALSGAAPADADRVEKSYQHAMEKWSTEVLAAATPEARAKAWRTRPDSAIFAREMWDIISPSLREEWTLEPVAWFLTLTCGQRLTRPDGSNAPAFAEQAAAIRAAIETYHMKSPKLPPVCLALVPNEAPQALALLEKIQTGHADKAVQGVAALAIAMRLKSLGDDPGLMTKRLTLLRKAIIDSAQVEISGISVAKLAEDELYIIRYLTKGRVAPDLIGTDSGSDRPFFSACASCMWSCRWRLWHCRHSTSGSLNTSTWPEATQTSRGRMIDESRPTTSSRPVTIDRHHCRLMFSFSSTPSGP